ncbi:MAG: DUF4173 domain-containing protein [Clostridia bacterium]|nr:DUF4173 domain-containing protein [Clostridia bacterium]
MQDPTMQNFTPPPQPPEASRFPYYTPPQPRRVFSGKDTLFAYLSLAVGYLSATAFPVFRTPLGAFLTLLLLFGLGTAYLLSHGMKPSLRASLCGGAFLVLGVSLITNGNATLRVFVYIAVLLGFLFFLADGAGLCPGGWFSNGLLQSAERAILRQPCTGWKHFWPALSPFRKGETGKRTARTLGWILLGLGAAVIPTAVIVALLSYDDQFTGLLERLFSFSLDGFWEVMGDLAVGVIFASVLFGALFALKLKKEANEPERETAGARTHVLPKALLCTAVTPILLVYVLFFISQSGYYLSALTHVLPGDLTYAEYARKGFFELCWVCGINALLLLFFNLFIVKKPGEKHLLQRIYSSVIAVFTLVLIATALSKMLLYIDSYGLTQKRVYASWFMLVLTFVFVVVLLRQILPRFPWLPTLAVGCFLLFALLCLPNTDARIANYNVNAYITGELNTVDVAALEDLGTSALPALFELHEHLRGQSDPSAKPTPQLEETKAAIHSLVKEMTERLEDEGFFAWDLPSLKIRAYLNGI